MIVFTGDIVNSRSTELIPHAATLSKLSAPDGVLSILGNHDYGDYASRPDKAAKQGQYGSYEVAAEGYGLASSA